MVYVESITAQNETRTIRDLNGQQMLATVQASTTASKAYAVGDYLILNDKVYKVTVAIASGGTITVGTNVTETKVGTELSDLNRQISESITPAIEEIETALDGKAPVIVNTASGDIASFADGADGMPVKSLVANIEPVQDLHGYANPWPAGGGKNKLNVPQSVSLSGAGFLVPSNTGINLPAGTYTLSFSASSVASGARYQIILNFGSTDVFSHTDSIIASTSITFTTEQDADTIRMFCNNSNACVYTNAMIESGSTATSYAPYSNICPITGWDSVTVNRTGVNVWDEEWENGYLGNTGAFISDSSSVCSKNYIPIKQSESFYGKCPDRKSLRICAYKEDKTFVSLQNITNAAFTLPAETAYIKFSIFGYGTTYANDISINYPSTDHDYHSGANNTTYSITFPAEAGTVYGGTLDVTNGVLTVDRAMVDLGSLAWLRASSGIPYRSTTRLTNAELPVSQDDNPNAISSAYKVVPYRQVSVTPACLTIVWEASSYYGQVWVNDTNDYTGDEFKAAVTGQKLVYLLATPTTYQLTPQQLDTLLGTNNIWSYVGTVDVEYPADTKLYIEQLTKPTEDDMTADHAISAGTFFMIGNTLYLATSQIAAGGTITSGTNATQLSLADALNQLNT